jgi:hypothetical protein
MSRAYASANKEDIQPRRLEISLNPENGSLLTAPLSQVLLTTTDGLYRDLYQMAHGELAVVTTAAAAADATEEESALNHNAAVSTRQERLSNLSFAQRRHEIAWRLAQHGRGLQHAAALCAAAASSDLSTHVRTASKALQHSRTAWVQADEAQDALYFFHAQLFPVRAAPHDIYGAADVHLLGRWLDLPTNLRVAADPYETSRPAEWTRDQVQEEWQLAIRDKLLTGEMGWMRLQQGDTAPPPWKVVLRGSRIQLTYGQPRHIQNAETQSEKTPEEVYPLSAWLTVIPIEDAAEDAHTTAEWSLLDLDVTVQAKTGEFNHQLETSNRQRFDLHRLAALSMTREEERARREAEEDPEAAPARPLNSIFRLSYTFLLSWQLELLSAQAQALRRGIWAAGEANPLEVTPIRFLDHHHPEGLLAILSISFWKVDDSYGPPALCDLVGDGHLPTEEDISAVSAKLRPHITTTSQLVLCIRADIENGIRVSVSGGSALQAPDTPEHSRRAARALLEAASNPLALSASDALLAATRLCAEQKCRAAVQALRTELPNWIELSLEHCGIVIAADINYHGIPAGKNHGHRKPVLFRLGCDARTGSFVALYSRVSTLLRRLAGKELQASEAMAVQVANLPANRTRAAQSESSGRIVRDAFDSLIRSMNVLGQRVGVGGRWDDLDEMSHFLRERTIGQACRDVRQALIRCCGIAALYGLSPLALGAAFGLNGVPDISGKAVLETVVGEALLNAPPVGILLDQELMESSATSVEGIHSKRNYLKQSIFALSCVANESGVTMVPMEIEIVLDTPVSVRDRKKVELIKFLESTEEKDAASLDHQPKKRRTERSGDEDATTLEEVDRFARILCATHDRQSS